MNSRSLTYSSFYLLFFSFQGLITGFFPLYCRNIGLLPFQIALVSASESLANLLGPLLLTSYLYQKPHTRKVLLQCSVAACFLFFLLYCFKSFFAVLVIWFLCLFVHKSILGVVDADAIRDDVGATIEYGRVRLWGSVGFMITVFVLGWQRDEFGISSTLLSGLFILGLLCAASTLVPEVSFEKEKKRAHTFKTFFASIYSKSLILFLLASMFSWAAGGLFVTYFSLRLEQLGCNGKLISLAWIVGVVAEVVIFVYFTAIEKYFSLVTVLRWSILLTVLRWVLVATSSSVWVIILSQTFHAFSFGSLHLSSMKLMHSMLPSEHRYRGQALLIAVSGGIGTLLGRLVGGLGAYVLGEKSDLSQLFWLSVALSAIAAYFAYKLKPSEETA
ncbi:MAG: MFS transporter [Deltaproteobacteria bacterium]|nr:MFS transporter [Deltaproteobacteria bacterium]